MLVGRIKYALDSANGSVSYCETVKVLTLLMNHNQRGLFQLCETALIFVFLYDVT